MLTITVLSHNEVPVTPTVTARFDEKGGTIGRSPDCTLQLLDPERVISRTHALIVLQEGRYRVRDQGTTVPVIVNGQVVGRGRAIRWRQATSCASPATRCGSSPP